jgi:polyisoprenoid-binding protein YceI
MRKIAPLVFAILTATSAMAADSYTIDPNHTLPVFEVNHLGFTTQRGRFDKTSGKIQLDREKKTGAVDWTIEADSIDMAITAHPPKL